MGIKTSALSMKYSRGGSIVKEIKQFENQIICGDCLDVMPSLPDGCADLILIDPPYLTTKESWDKEEIVSEKLSQELIRIAKPSCSLYCWCGIGEKSQSLIRWIPIFSELWKFKDLITWKKKRGIGMRKGWLYAREEIMWFVKNNNQFVWNKESQYSDEKQSGKFGFENLKIERATSEFKRIPNIWIDIPEQMKGSRTHFTPKPQKAIERIILAHTKEGDTVFDCFAGIGTTCKAAQNLGRRYIGIEISPEYCKIARTRTEHREALFA